MQQAARVLIKQLFQRQTTETGGRNGYLVEYDATATIFNDRSNKTPKITSA